MTSLPSPPPMTPGNRVCNRLRPAGGPARRALLVTAGALVLLGVGGSAPAQSSSRDHQIDPDQIRERITALSDSLMLAVQAFDLAEDALARVRRQIGALQDDLDRLGDDPAALGLHADLLDLRRRLMDMRLRRSFPELLDLPGEFAPGTGSRFRPGDDSRSTWGISSRNNIVRIGEPVEVGVLERVRGDVISVGGRVTVRGTVTGNVVAIGSDVHVTSTGRVDGTAFALGGRVRHDAGGTIRGDYMDSTWHPGLIWSSHRLLGLGLNLAAFFFVLLAVVLVGLVLPTNVEHVEQQVRARLGTSFLVGLAVQIGFPVVFVLLLITIVGIPVALVLLPVALAGLLLIGFAGTAQSVGHSMERRGLGGGSSPLGMIVWGAVVLQLLPLLARGAGLVSPSPLKPILFSVHLLGVLVLYAAWTSGLGAALMTRFGSRLPAGLRPAATPAGPPPSPAQEGGAGSVPE
jgi:hypothetical protein